MVVARSNCCRMGVESQSNRSCNHDLTNGVSVRFVTVVFTAAAGQCIVTLAVTSCHVIAMMNLTVGVKSTRSDRWLYPCVYQLSGHLPSASRSKSLGHSGVGRDLERDGQGHSVRALVVPLCWQLNTGSRRR